MMIPDSSGVSREIQVPVALIWLSGAAVVILLLATVFLTSSFLGDQVTISQVDDLKAENQKLSSKYEQLRWDLAEVDARYAELVNKEIALRTMFGLPEINTEERELGIGGPTPPALLSMTEAQHKAYSTEAEVDRLLRLTRFELEKFEEVETKLVSLKDRLDHTPSIWPTKGWNSRGFGMKFDPFTGYKQFHRGIDVANKTGTPIIATARGRVKSVGRTGSMGKTIVINHGYGFSTRYGHLSEYAVKNGQKVDRGDIIGYMGSTGYSTGPHLHYEVWRNGKALDPREHILNTK